MEKSGYYSILIKNRIAESILSENRKLHTTKTDKQHHGYGLKTVKILAESHNGMVDIYEKDGFFIVNALLNIWNLSPNDFFSRLGTKLLTETIFEVILCL